MRILHRSAIWLSLAWAAVAPSGLAAAPLPTSNEPPAIQAAARDWKCYYLGLYALSATERWRVWWCTDGDPTGAHDEWWWIPG